MKKDSRSNKEIRKIKKPPKTRSQTDERSTINPRVQKRGGPLKWVRTNYFHSINGNKNIQYIHCSLHIHVGSVNFMGVNTYFEKKQYKPFVANFNTGRLA